LLYKKGKKGVRYWEKLSGSFAYAWVFWWWRHGREFWRGGPVAISS
jgi:hypothetical protein